VEMPSVSLPYITCSMHVQASIVDVPSHARISLLSNRSITMDSSAVSALWMASLDAVCGLPVDKSLEAFESIQ
jgi:hypothetical protein